METQEEGSLVKGNLLTRMHVDETIIITMEDKRTEIMRIPCKNSATSGESKHKALVLNCITVLIRVQKLIFEQYPSSQTTNDDNKLVEDSNNFIVVVIPRVVGDSRNFYLP